MSVIGKILCRTSHGAASPQKKASPTEESIEKLRLLIQKYGWNGDLLLAKERLSDPLYSAFLAFLYDSRLIFSIRGYEASDQSPAISDISQGIQIINGEPHILKEGEWTSWRQIIETFTYEGSRGIIRRDENPAHRWSYFFPVGLTPMPTGLSTPAYQMTKTALQQLRNHSSMPQNSTSSRLTGGYVQVVTDEDDWMDPICHITVRVITRKGEVFSVGYQTLPADAQKKKGRLAACCSEVSSFLSTRNAYISPMDYKEFVQFKNRRVTTLRVDAPTFKLIFKRLQTLTSLPLKHNYLNQSCAGFAFDVLKLAGASLDMQSHSLVPAILRILPAAGFKPIANQLSRAGHYHYDYILAQPGIEMGLKFITLPLTLMKNITFVALGAGKTACPLRTNNHRDLELDPKMQKLIQFSSPFKQWTDWFKDHPIEMTYRLVDWQQAQGKATRIYAYEGPKFYI